MKYIKHLIVAIDGINRWIARRAGFYLIDVVLYRRKARQLDELADVVERAGLAKSAADLRSSAARYRQRAVEVAR